MTTPERGKDMPEEIWVLSADESAMPDWFNSDVMGGVKYIRADLAHKERPTLKSLLDKVTPDNIHREVFAAAPMSDPMTQTDLQDDIEFIEMIFNKWFRTHGQECTEEYRQRAKKHFKTLIQAATAAHKLAAALRDFLDEMKYDHSNYIFLRESIEKALADFERVK